ncbi:Zinc metalloproteinase nas-13 [Bulinus truncatus]|nr:Zinc metalloproteinase nas-13 [Bulinus truncatus]
MRSRTLHIERDSTNLYVGYNTTLMDGQMHRQEKIRNLTKRKAVKHEILRWTDATIPYEFDTRVFNWKEIDDIKTAMKTWSSKTCLTFQPAKSTDKNRIRFTYGVGCYSQLGMVGGTQTINLDQRCRQMGLYLHEIGHAIGLLHEHQLPERDDYITVNLANVEPAFVEWFNKYHPSQINNYGVQYEYSSIMHYETNAFSRNNKKTLSSIDKNREHEIGAVRSKGLSFTDNKVVNLMYKCNKHSAPDANCKDPGYLDRNCRCVCPPGVDCTKDGQNDRKGGGWGIVCRNTYKPEANCSEWAQSGQCKANPDFMELSCRKSCGLCPEKDQDSSVCKNEHAFEANCGAWAQHGHCKTNPEFMEKSCRKSCGLCPEKDQDSSELKTEPTSKPSTKQTTRTTSKPSKETTRATIRTTSEPSTKPTARSSSKTTSKPSTKPTTRTTSKSTSKPSTKPTTRSAKNCRNRHADEASCNAWAARGDCKKPKAWVLKHCAKSCNSC